MRRALSAPLVILSLVCAPCVSAQAGSQPHLILSVFGGVRGGQTLWTLPNQPFLVQTLLGPNPGQYDTLDLAQQLVPGFVAGATASYFPGAHLGVQGEIAFLGMSLESRCAIRLYQPAEPADLNPQLCFSLQGQTNSTSAVSLAAGVTARLAPTGSMSPYLRLNGGLVTRARGTIKLTGTYRDNTNRVSRAVVVADDAPNRSAAGLTLAAGLAIALGSGYQLRLEGRDVYTRLDRVTGAADPSAGTLRPPHSPRAVHNLVFSMALDVILEQKRGRRY